jgi:hypothetical protein
MNGNTRPIVHQTYNGFRQHERRGESPPAGTCGCLEAKRKYCRERKKGTRRGECSCCGKQDTPLCGHDGEQFCRTCYGRWRNKGFTGNGPGPGFYPAIERAREHRETIETMSTREASWKIGVSAHTVNTWRKLLRKAADHGP